MTIAIVVILVLKIQLFWETFKQSKRFNLFINYSQLFNIFLNNFFKFSKFYSKIDFFKIIFPFLGSHL